jgi:polyphosphate kinase
VVALAADSDLPLLERVKLCAIASSNLDEFFAVRIARLLAQERAGTTMATPDGRLPAETLADCRDCMLELVSDQASLWLEELRPALAAEKIHVLDVADCRPRELAALARRFRNEIAPLLTPVAVESGRPFPWAPALALNVGVLVQDSDSVSRLIRVNVPSSLARLVPVGRSSFVLLENAVVAFLAELLGDVQATGHAVFRVTRDSDFPISREADDMLEAMESQLLQRRFADIVRLEVDSAAPAELVDFLRRELAVSGDQLYESDAPLGLRDLQELTQLNRPDLKEPRWRPVTRPAFANRRPPALLAQIRRHDILVHHPYDSFDSSVGAFVAAARDPKVGALKATVYRTDGASPTLTSLVKTAEEEKQAVAVVELNARFDERRNIEWSKALERAGVDVFFGEPDLKVHAKLTMLARQERGVTRRYVHIGTGNYHASNASNYEDLGLFTADAEIAADVADLFNAVTARTRPAPFRKLLVGPWFLRDGLMRELAAVTTAARAGEPARIRLKVNAVADPGIVDALYAAASAGARVEIVARGICVLRSGFPTRSARITVRSVLGRFLEHSRFFTFEAGSRASTWIGSADLMPRNLDRRVEVLAPIEDARLRSEIGHVFDALLADTRFSWQLERDGSWSRTSPAPGEPSVSAQEALMQRALEGATPA